MERTKGRVSMAQAADNSKLTRKKLSCKHLKKMEQRFTKEQRQLVNLTMVNACSYHKHLKDWFKEQSLRTLLAYCHPLDRPKYVFKLEQAGINI